MPKTKSKSTYGQGATFFRDDKKLWVGVVELGVDENGKRLRKDVTSKSRDKMLAKQRAAQHLHDQGLPTISEVLTVRGWLEHWVEHIAPSKATKSHEWYRNILTYYVYPHIGRKPIAKYQPEDFERLLGKLKAQGLSDSTRSSVRKTMHAAFAEALRRSKVQRNVIALTHKIEVEPRISDAMNAAQVQQVIAAADGDRMQALAVLVLMMGLRQGEALNARWSDLTDLDGPKPQLSVPKAKTKSGVRKVPLPEPVVAALKVHRAQQVVERMAADVWGDPDLIFPNTIGTLLDRRKCLRWWHALTENAGVGRRRFHSSRHTAATVMRNAGVPLDVVSKILGHSNYAITADIYAELDAETLRGAADIIGQTYAKDYRTEQG